MTAGPDSSGADPSGQAETGEAGQAPAAGSGEAGQAQAGGSGRAEPAGHAQRGIGQQQVERAGFGGGFRPRLAGCVGPRFPGI